MTEIGDNAFRNCPVLSGVSLPRTLIKLGNNAFRGTALTEVVIPDSTTTIGCYVFMDCMGLKTAYVSNNVNSWGLDWGTSGVFSNCMGLEYVYFGDGLSKIPDLILKNCISLKGVYVPASVISVGVNALKDAAPECVIYGEAGSYAEAFAGESLHAFTAAEFPVVY